MVGRRVDGAWGEAGEQSVKVAVVQWVKLGSEVVGCIAWQAGVDIFWLSKILL